jgi:hypothetical protein
MTLRRHPDIRIQRLAIGRELAPLVVIDNLAAEPDELVEMAVSKNYGSVASYYPGIRAKAPLTYHQFILRELREVMGQSFGLTGGSLRMTSCHFSLITTPPEKLAPIQTIPHVDSYESNELAFVHYLFKKDFGGTAFYRHRRTGYEFIDPSRKVEYTKWVNDEAVGPDHSALEYINGDTPLYEQVGKQEGIFNRLVMYRRNTLHSGCIGRDFVVDPDPRRGRLSLNGFIA